MTSLLHSLLRDNSCRVYNSDMRVRLSEKRYVYPDVSISCDPRDQGRIDILQYPRLVAEMLSPSTEAFDRGKKFGYYRACPTIEEYVLADTQWQTVEVYRRATNDLWVLRSFGSDDQVELASLNISFPVAALYENVIFPEDTSDS